MSGDLPPEPSAAAADAARAALARYPWPAPVLEALARLGADGPAYLVGGTVRDVLSGREPRAPWDVATPLTPTEVMARFTRVEPLGIGHGTVLILHGETRIECTTFRSEGAYRDARHPDRVSFTDDVLADLARRDLTVNAMAWDPTASVLLDPHGGLADLHAGLLRAVGDPRDRFHEDALRPLRAARLAATLEMALEPRTRAALGSARDRARLLAVERVRDELERLMTAPRPSVGFELLREASLLELWMPELTRCYGVPQNRFHAWDVFDHSLLTCDAAPREKPRVRWAALLHDIGKPDTRVERRGDGTFYNHQYVGAELAEALLARLRFPNEERARIVHLVREHMFDYHPEWSDAALRRWLRRVGTENVADLFDLRIADALGNGTRVGFPGYLEGMRERIERVLAESAVLRVTDLAVDGRDVMEVLGIPPGPPVRLALERLLEEVLEHPDLNRRERLRARLAEWRGAGAGDAPGAPSSA